LYITGQHSITELHPQPCDTIFMNGKHMLNVEYLLIQIFRDNFKLYLTGIFSQ
jgi:hypothetical protein